MRIIEIQALPNGAHRNLTGTLSSIPDGYAIIPDNMETPNFPFGEVETEIKNGVYVVTKWIPGILPEIKEEEQPVGDVEQIRADIDFLALMTGVTL